MIPALYRSLQKMGEFVNMASKEAGFDDSEAYKVQLAVDEACTNIIEHAYGGENPDEEIVCDCTATEASIKIKLHDHGRAFDPEKVPAPDVRSGLSKRLPGGLGLFFIRQLMDDVVFRFDPGLKDNPAEARPDRGNILVLTKHKKALK